MSYRLQKIIGRGMFGTTWKGLDKDNNIVAIKSINIRKSEQRGVSLNEIAQEADTLRRLSERGGCGKYITCYYTSFVGNYEGELHAFLISEFIEGTELRTFIERGPQPLTIMWPIFTQLLLGLRYIHSQGYAHRDIKPENILITPDNVIKYIDFGISCLQKCNRSFCIDNCRVGPGTVLYSAPEILSRKAPNTFGAAKAGDVWSLSVVLFELANGSFVFPFYLRTGNETLNQSQIIANIIVAPQLTSNYTLDNGQTNTFIMNLLINDWTKRPTSSEAVEMFLEDVVGSLTL